MTDAAQVLAQHGLQNVFAIIQAAQLEHIDLPVAATMLSKESGGRNVWGSDGVSTGGTYVKGSAVTKSAYLAYRDAVRAGRIGRQGCGPAQCTSAGYQDTADALGGCWDPVANIRSGLRGLGGLITRYGVQQGARRYNGSGPAAEAYGRDFAARYAVWKSRLTGATVPPMEDDDMTPDQDARLARIETVLKMMWEQFAGPGADPFSDAKRFTGWPANTPDRTPRTLVDIGRHSDEHLAAIEAKLT